MNRYCFVNTRTGKRLLMADTELPRVNQQYKLISITKWTEKQVKFWESLDNALHGALQTDKESARSI